MRVTSAGQVSVPAAVRRRWGTTRVRIIDEGHRLIVEPEPENPFADLLGALAGSGPSHDDRRAEDRAVDDASEERKWPR